MKLLSIFLSLIILFPTNLNSQIESLNLNSENYLLYSFENDKILAEVNSTEKLSAASMNKILTTITILDRITDLDEEIVVSAEVFDHIEYYESVANLVIGQKLTTEDLLYSILLPSGSDAIVTLGLYYFDTLDNLVDAMNAKAAEIGMKKTKIKHHAGHDTKGQYTTLSDLLTLIKYALNNEVFKNIYTSHTYTYKNNPTITIHDKIMLEVENQGFYNLVGTKSGYTLETKRALTSLLNIKDSDYIFITTGAEGGYTDNNGAINDLITVGKHLEENINDLVVTDKFDQKVFINLKKQYVETEETRFNVVAYSHVDIDDFNIYYYPDNFIKAPLSIGDSIGEVSLFYKNDLLDIHQIIASEDIKKSYTVLISSAGVLVLLILLVKKLRG